MLRKEEKKLYYLSVKIKLKAITQQGFCFALGHHYVQVSNTILSLTGDSPESNLKIT